MKIITCAGYFATGSSAISDFLSEFSNVEVLNSNFECRIVQDPNGISDLDYNLVENNHRHNSGNAIKNFQRLIKFYGLDRLVRMENYEHYFKGEFSIITSEYIKKLIGLSYPGGWHFDIYNMSTYKIVLLKIKMRIYNKLFCFRNLSAIDEDCKNRKITPMARVLDQMTTFISYPGENFYEYTREYLDALFSTALNNKDNFLMIDQLVPPSNTKRYLRYFNNIKIICVDRDPRDVYIITKEFLRSNVVPKNISDYITWYKLTRIHRNVEVDDEKFVLRLRFEQLIYEYDRTINEIIHFLELDPKYQNNKRMKFNPDVSIKNTRLWLKYPKYEQDIKMIENELQEYCYQLPK